MDLSRAANLWTHVSGYRITLTSQSIGQLPTQLFSLSLNHSFTLIAKVYFSGVNISHQMQVPNQDNQVTEKRETAIKLEEITSRQGLSDSAHYRPKAKTGFVLLIDN